MYIVSDINNVSFTETHLVNAACTDLSSEDVPKLFHQSNNMSMIYYSLLHNAV